jgi:hypothetical protein
MPLSAVDHVRRWPLFLNHVMKQLMRHIRGLSDPTVQNKPTISSSSFPFPFVTLQSRGCLVAPWFLWIVLVPCAGDQSSDRGGEWRDEYDRVSKQDRLGLTPDLTTRDLFRSRRWAKERGNEKFCLFIPVGLQSSFTCHKILRHGTFPIYFPSERKVCCGFLSPLKIHRLGRVLNPQPLGPVAITLTTTSPRWPVNHFVNC